MLRNGVEESVSETGEILDALDLLPHRSLISRKVLSKDETVLRRVRFGEISLQVEVSGKSFVSENGDRASNGTDC
jgi:hypothetical protein